jgi:hypothetical protein
MVISIELGEQEGWRLIAQITDGACRSTQIWFQLYLLLYV